MMEWIRKHAGWLLTPVRAGSAEEMRALIAALTHTEDLIFEPNAEGWM
jgi:hypothetical protein